MDFEAQISAFCKRAEDNTEATIRAGVIELASRVIGRTPFGMPDTWVRGRAPPGYVPGQARAGWHIGSGRPLVALPARPDAHGGATLAAIVAALPARIGGKVLYLSNNVAYIWELERGYSKQSPPSAMVGLTVMEFNSILAQKALEVVH